MSKNRNEVSYYPEIRNYIEQQLKSNFRASRKKELYVYWGIGELKTKLHEIIENNPVTCGCVRHFAQNVPPLNLDIFAIITDGKQFELLILEIKLLKSVGLKEWSQLVGYCLVSGAKYGLLVNIDNGASKRLSDILSTEKNLSFIETNINGRTHRHHLGCMCWDSVTQDFEYCNLGIIKSLSNLSQLLENEFVFN